MRRTGRSARTRSLHYSFHCLVEIRISTDIARQTACSLCLLALAGQHQNSLGIDGRRRFQVAQRIADARYARQLGVESMGDFLEKSRLGLTAGTACVSAMRAEKDGVDAAADLRERFV